MAANRLLGGGFRLLAGLKVTHASNRGVKGFNGPPRATPHGPTVFAHGFRMACAIARRRRARPNMRKPQAAPPLGREIRHPNE